MRRVITEADIPQTGEFRIASGSIITPSARDIPKDRGVKLVEVPADQLDSTHLPAQTIALGSDHGGFALKRKLKPIFEELRLHVRDVGVDEEKPADYPDIAREVAEIVARGEAARGFIIDGAGIGSAIVANKFRGVRAALCYDKASARNSREHNDSNVLTRGGRRLTASPNHPIAGGRHAPEFRKSPILKRP